MSDIASQKFSPEGEEQIRAILREYLKENLTVFVSSQRTWDEGHYAVRTSVSIYLSDDLISQSSDYATLPD